MRSIPPLTTFRLLNDVCLDEIKMNYCLMAADAGNGHDLISLSSNAINAVIFC
ncbi:MAG: hypothetical protein ACTS85_00025 [Arsenophonus sp. NC-PG7-MAG3]